MKEKRSDHLPTCSFKSRETFILSMQHAACGPTCENSEEKVIEPVGLDSSTGLVEKLLVEHNQSPSHKVRPNKAQIERAVRDRLEIAAASLTCCHRDVGWVAGAIRWYSTGQVSEAVEQGLIQATQKGIDIAWNQRGKESYSWEWQRIVQAFASIPRGNKAFFESLGMSTTIKKCLLNTSLLEEDWWKTFAAAQRLFSTKERMTIIEERFKSELEKQPEAVLIKKAEHVKRLTSLGLKTLVKKVEEASTSQGPIFDGPVIQVPYDGHVLKFRESLHELSISDRHSFIRRPPMDRILTETQVATQRIAQDFPLLFLAQGPGVVARANGSASRTLPAGGGAALKISEDVTVAFLAEWFEYVLGPQMTRLTKLRLTKVDRLVAIVWESFFTTRGEPRKGVTGDMIVHSLIPRTERLIRSGATLHGATQYTIASDGHDRGKVLETHLAFLQQSQCCKERANNVRWLLSKDGSNPALGGLNLRNQYMHGDVDEGTPRKNVAVVVAALLLSIEINECKLLE